jgi:CrcB protein
MTSTELQKTTERTTLPSFLTGQRYGAELEQILLISFGAVLGANARYWIGDWASNHWGSSFPYGTLLINLSGSLIMGFFIAYFMQRLNLDPRWRLIIAVGFLGSYTTFSSYTLESVQLMSAGQLLSGLVNLFGSAILGGITMVIGLLLGKAF